LNDFGYGARNDVIAAVEWIKENNAGRPIIAWGQSLGSAAALFAAEELGGDVAGYILECPYRDLRTAVWNRLNQRLPLPLNYVAYTGMKLVSPLVVPHAKQISPLKAAAKLPASIPVLVLAGGIDQRAFVAESRDICDCCKDRSQLVVFEKADHLKLLEEDEATYRKSVLDFIEKCSVGRDFKSDETTQFAPSSRRP
jgi:alpha-beta hydrolase superfamily lysophospholipase